MYLYCYSWNPFLVSPCWNLRVLGQYLWIFSFRRKQNTWELNIFLLKSMIEKLITLRNILVMLITMGSCPLPVMFGCQWNWWNPVTSLEQYSKHRNWHYFCSYPKICTYDIAKFRCMLDFSLRIYSETLRPCGIAMSNSCDFHSFCSFTNTSCWLFLILEVVLISRSQRISTLSWVKVDD